MYAERDVNKAGQVRAHYYILANLYTKTGILHRKSVKIGQKVEIGHDGQLTTRSVVVTRKLSYETYPN